MNNLRRLSLVLVLFIAFSSGAWAGVGDELGLSPFWDWKEIKTEHFRLVFPQQITQQAEKAAKVFEEAHTDLSVDLRWQPLTRVNVLLVDNSDAANGLTSPTTRFGMLLYLTPPDPFFSIDYYDDWLRMLVYHEYTHFLNMDPTRGLYSAFRIFFGDVLLPNSVWPSWMLEGYAVYNETKYSRAGRGRSPYWDGILRTAVESGALDRSDWITLDQVNGPHPRFPTGEVAYLFGYHLMKAAEKGRSGTLSEMTERSSSRVPFFINGNLKNITGRNWYDHWDAWVAEASAKMTAQLAKIKSLPVSTTEVLDGTRDEALGIAFSPDRRWAAYSSESDAEWQTLKLREWKPGAKPKAIDDKFFGAAIVFTPDSKRVVYSSLHRKKNYYFYSDLRAYDLTTDKAYWITDGARAKDPDISKDGKRITYTESSDAGNDLILGDLVEQDGKLVIESKWKIVDVNPGDRIANPKFSLDGKNIIFSRKIDGNLRETLENYSLEKDEVSPLVDDEFRNRFPTLDAMGSIYFVSDKSGVDNLYRYEREDKTTLLTNVTGALWLPAFRGADLYASVLSKDGFSIARVQTFSDGIDPEKIRVEAGEDAPTAPGRDTAKPTIRNEPSPYSVEDYSAFSTLLPRQWAPFLIADANSTYVGGQILGYDNTFQHQYFLLGAHDSTARTMDFSVLYENRSFGPTLSLAASKLTSDVFPTSFTRNDRMGATLSFPFQGTTSRFTPTVAYRVERDSFYDLAGGVSELFRQTRLVPEQDVLLEYQNTRSTRLAVTQETGSLTTLGMRRYGLEGRDLFKGIIKHTQFYHLGGHAVLSPTLKAMKVNRRDPSFLTASALSRGKRGRVINPTYSDDLDEFGIRGYPLRTFTSREAITLAADLKFPVAAIFRGWGTNPLFFEQLTMQIFAEDTYRLGGRPTSQHLPSVGAGLRLGVDALLYIPFDLGADYHYGFNKDALGQGEFFFSITASSALSF